MNNYPNVKFVIFLKIASKYDCKATEDCTTFAFYRTPDSTECADETTGCCWRIAVANDDTMDISCIRILIEKILPYYLL